MSSPYQLSSTHPVCGYQKGTPLAIGTPHLAVLRFIVRAATLFMLLDPPGDTGAPRRYRGDNSPSDIVSQGPTLHGLPAEPQATSFTRPFCAKQVSWL